MGVITYKCPNCGGGLTFNADIQKYRCEYCLSEFSQEELDEIENKELEKAEENLPVLTLKKKHCFAASKAML